MKVGTSRPAPSARACGFTLLELMILVALIAVISAISVPNLMSARMQGNASSAVATMRTIATAQSQFKKSAKADEDEDGTGEYGFLAELSGRLGARGGEAIPPADLPLSLGMVNSAGEIQRSGYTMRVYLPEAGGVAHREEPDGGVAAGVLDPNLSELTWCIYAWPTVFGGTGKRTFFLTESGGVTFTENLAYSGADCAAIVAGSALLTANPSRMTARPAVGTRGADGGMWKRLR